MNDMEYITIPAGVTISDNVGYKHVLKDERELKVVQYQAYSKRQGVWICEKPRDIVCGGGDQLGADLSDFAGDEHLCVFIEDRDVSCAINK